MTTYFFHWICIVSRCLLVIGGISFERFVTAAPYEIHVPGGRLNGVQLPMSALGFDTIIFDGKNAIFFVGIQELRTSTKIVLSHVRTVEASLAGNQAFLGVPDLQGIINAVSLRQDGKIVYLESDYHDLQPLIALEVDSALLFEPGDVLDSDLRRSVGEPSVSTIPVRFTSPIFAISIAAGSVTQSPTLFLLDPRGSALRAGEDGRFPLITGRHSFDRLDSAPTMTDLRVIDDTMYHCHPDGGLIFVNPPREANDFTLRFNHQRGTCQFLQNMNSTFGELIEISKVKIPTDCSQAFTQAFQNHSF